jgi:PAS domain-containing protein
MITTTPIGPEQLRAHAEDRLQDRSAPSSAGWTISPETLSLLYRLSSDPDSASDALKLLHELQTHQVELDLQHAQLLENENELHALLAHYRALFEQAPAGYLLLGSNGRILQSNQTAGELLGLDTTELENHLFGSLFSPGSKVKLTRILEQAGQVGPNQAVDIETLDLRRLRLVAGKSAFDDAVLLMLIPDASARHD